MDYYTQIEEAAAYIRDRMGAHAPIETAIVLGSGLGPLADTVEKATVIPVKEIPHFPQPSVHGHAGQFVIGELAGHSVAVLKGRVHFYEGYTMAQVTLPVRIFKALGATNLVVTNASGGLSKNLKTGDLMLITDHIHAMPNPLIGPNDPRLGPRFPQMAACYDLQYLDVARQTALQVGIPLQEGVYLGLTGPSYETPAEIRQFTTWGADTLGMSTTPEVIVANHSSLRVLGISCVTNVLHSGPCHDTHQDVLNVGNRSGPEMGRLLTEILKNMAIATSP